MVTAWNPNCIAASHSVVSHQGILINKNDSTVYTMYPKWPDKSTTSYNMLHFKSYIKNLYGKYLVIERHMLQIQGILLQYLKFDLPICPL